MPVGPYAVVVMMPPPPPPPPAPPPPPPLPLLLPLLLLLPTLLLPSLPSPLLLAMSMLAALVSRSSTRITYRESKRGTWWVDAAFFLATAKSASASDLPPSS